jgi:hypothetical protein
MKDRPKDWATQMYHEGAWIPRPVVDEGRKRGQRKLRSVNKDRALAMRYGLAAYPKRRAK